MRGGVRERFPKLTEHGMTMARALGSYLRWAPNKGILSIFRTDCKYYTLLLNPIPIVLTAWRTLLLLTFIVGRRSNRTLLKS